jgi:hypothetical protein
MTTTALAVAAIVALAAQPAGEYRADRSARDVSLGYSVSPTDLTVAQRIVVTLRVTAPAGWSIAWPAVGEKLGRATVVSTTDARDGLTHTRTITLEPYLPGDDTIPSLSVSVSPRDPQAAASPVTLSTEPVKLTIRALLPDDPAQSLELPQLRGEREPAGSKPVPVAAIIGGAVALLGAGVAGAVIATRRKPVAVDHAALALAAIDAVAAAPAPTSGAARNAALDELGAAARRFLQARGVAGAVGAATPDLAPMLARVPHVAAVADRLTALLTAIDAARFDPRRASEAPGPLAAQLAAVLRTLVPAPADAVGRGAA